MNIFRIFRRFRRKDDGSVATEFALVLPIYLMVIMMIVELARIVFVQAAVTFAAEEATRYAIVNYNSGEDSVAADEAIEAVAADNLLGLPTTQIIKIDATGVDDATGNTRELSVTVIYQYIPILPIHKFFGGISDTGFEITGQSIGFIMEDIVVG